MRIFLLFCVLFSACKFIAQNANIAGHMHIDQGSNIISINSKCFYLHSVSYCCGNSLSVVGINNAGQNVFETATSFGDVNNAVKLLRTKDNCLAVLGGSDHCDTPTDQYSKNFLVKFDTNGVIKFQTYINNLYTINNVMVLERFHDFTQYTDSSYYLVSDSVLYHYSKTGQFISKVNTGLTSIVSITTLSNGHFLFNAKINNVLKNIEMTILNSITNQQTAVHAIGKFIQNQAGNFYGVTTGGSLEKYDSNLNFILAAAITGISDFVMKHDSLYTTGIASGTNTIFYAMLDPNFSVLYQIQANYKKVYPNSIAINNQNKINIMTVGTSSPNIAVTFTGLYQLKVTGNFSSKYDIGVTGISALLANYAPVGNIPPGSTISYPADVAYNLNITVKNYGPDTVKRFYLNRYFLPGSTCYSLFHKRYDTIILPNSSVVVQTGLITGEQVGVTLAGLQADAPIFMNFCFFTTVPNLSNDIGISNDESCQSIQIIQSATGIDKNSLPAFKFELFPNPFDNTLQVQSDIEIKAVSVYNALGIIEQQKTVNKNEFMIDGVALPAGIYFIKLTTGKGTVIKKVVKE